MKYTIIIGSIGLVLLFMSCNSYSGKKSTPDVRVYSEINLEYAKGFKIFKSANDVKLLVKNPWQNASDITFEYVLSSDTAANKNAIKTPIQKAVCLSTTHLAYISAVGMQKSVCGITNPKLVNDTLVQSQLISKLTHNIGNEQALNYETILSLQPDVIFAYGVGAEVQSVYHKFAEWGIPVVIVAEYLEDSPLAKTEWLKFFSYFYNETELADTLFNEIAIKYLNYKELVVNSDENPVVMSSLPWKGVWYVPGGASFMANFIKDAGGNYLFKNKPVRESLNLAIEEVMLEGQKADIWIHTGMASSLTDIKSADVRLVQLPALKSKNVYNNNKRQNSFGGNDFWESGVVNPHLILRDLIQIFHPEVLDDTSLYYYQKLN